MDIYFIIIEAVPRRENPESRLYGGAYINCWVKAGSEKEAVGKAMEYIEGEHWSGVYLEEVDVAERSRYFDLPESLACFDMAGETGVAAMFYTWLVEE